MASFALLMLTLGVTSSVFASTQHEVRSGQSLARIAQRYRVSVRALAAANRLGPDASLRPGQTLTVPESGEVFVAPGDTLARIASANDVSADDLARANRLRPNAALRAGQILVLPGAVREREEGPSSNSERSWGTPRQRGVVTIDRHGLRRPAKIRLVDARGRANRRAIQRLGQLMLPSESAAPRAERTRNERRPRNARAAQPPARLVELLAKISDHFGGRKIYLASGYRPAGGYTRESSRHTQGHAIDIRVHGVPNTVLRDYCRRFDRVGVGYYPNSTFVHFDVRDESAYWVDVSRPGQAPQYRSSARAERDSASRDENSTFGTGDSEETPSEVHDAIAPGDTDFVGVDAEAEGPPDEGTAGGDAPIAPQD